ncbi:error-prone DNA polymerase, DnaE-like [Arboricoccus pini]|uniref:Error-prone DNA polymerase n=1 Tax=Arboricoccus pini TaxID=1963835 RepID=A0A212QQD5_9PROT|nr:error-prone DNA polymerase [Arboricoccus pini]SNB61650.1 error-prone DNA polymerase, DnaE-like [Arboricoccus pini]
MCSYVELQVTSNFSFLRGASHPEELIVRAAELGLAGMALTDRNSLAGVVRAHVKAKELQAAKAREMEAAGLTGQEAAKPAIRFVVGVRLDIEDGPSFLCWPTDRPAYARLTSLLTTGNRRTTKGRCVLRLGDLTALGAGQLLAVLPPETLLEDEAQGQAFRRLLADLGRRWRGSFWLVLQHRMDGCDDHRLAALAALAREAGLPLLATGDVHYHLAERRPLQDVLTCIREHCTIATAGYRLFAHAERHLRSPAAMAMLFADYPDALAAGHEILGRIRFSLDDLAYDYPIEPTYEGRTPQGELAHRVAARLPWRYPGGTPDKVVKAVAHELALIESLNYAPYFLTVDDIVRHAREKGILCQGRGSAANSAVCYVLGITSVDPAKINLLFERFLSGERNEPPDIDVDFEHERREEVMQWIFERYGRDHAGIVATVIRYRAKSALREVAKVMGIGADMQAALSRTIWGWGRDGVSPEAMREAGIPLTDGRILMTLELAATLIDFPRHLSQHTGGFVIARSPLRDLVPIHNAAMEDRTVVEWDKDDIEALGMLKIDVLALGMLSCIRRAFDLLRAHRGLDLDLATLPEEDLETYEMLCEADSIGVFQVESRAQMSMLPRLRPMEYYDLVIEVAIVRPGPIQGDMVHPYLRRRDGLEPIIYPKPELEAVLGKTKGVPLFQEQAMQIAIVAAGFTAAEADGLRRAMATFKHKGRLEYYENRLIEGMIARGYEREFAERCFRQIEGFGYYGFPESHAASFALLVYVSAWLKRHHPDIFLAAILNAQPMGFYAPAQLVGDARRHEVEVEAPDVNHSFWDTVLEACTPSFKRKDRVRLGFRQIKGMRLAAAAAIVRVRAEGGAYRSIEDLWARVQMGREVLILLADADAFRSLGIGRHLALWIVEAILDPRLPLLEMPAKEGSNRPPAELLDAGAEDLPPLGRGEEVIADYGRLGLSLKGHPIAFLRDWLTDRSYVAACTLAEPGAPEIVKVAGLVLLRQRPGSAKGVIFMTLEDETGPVNVIVWPDVFARYRRILLGSRFMGVAGRLQRVGKVIHVIARRPVDLTPALARLKDADLSPEPSDRSDGSEGRERAAALAVRDVIPEGRNFR